eukprot:g6204.t1
MLDDLRSKMHQNSITAPTLYSWMDVKKNHLVRLDEFIKGLSVCNWRPMPSRSDCAKLFEYFTAAANSAHAVSQYLSEKQLLLGLKRPGPVQEWKEAMGGNSMLAVKAKPYPAAAPNASQSTDANEISLPYKGAKRTEEATARLKLQQSKIFLKSMSNSWRFHSAKNFNLKQMLESVRSKLKAACFAFSTSFDQEIKKDDESFVTRLLHLEFEKMDVDKDGDLSYSEFCSVLRRLVKISDEEIRLLLEVIDYNHDGCIAYPEFLVFCINKELWSKDSLKSVSTETMVNEKILSDAAQALSCLPSNQFKKIGRHIDNSHKYEVVPLSSSPVTEAHAANLKRLLRLFQRSLYRQNCSVQKFFSYLTTTPVTSDGYNESIAENKDAVSFNQFRLGLHWLGLEFDGVVEVPTKDINTTHDDWKENYRRNEAHALFDYFAHGSSVADVHMHHIIKNGSDATLTLQDLITGLSHGTFAARRKIAMKKERSVRAREGGVANNSPASRELRRISMDTIIQGEEKQKIWSFLWKTFVYYCNVGADPGQLPDHLNLAGATELFSHCGLMTPKGPFTESHIRNIWSQIAVCEHHNLSKCHIAFEGFFHLLLVSARTVYGFSDNPRNAFGKFLSEYVLSSTSVQMVQLEKFQSISAQRVLDTFKDKLRYVYESFSEVGEKNQCDVASILKWRRQLQSGYNMYKLFKPSRGDGNICFSEFVEIAKRVRLTPNPAMNELRQIFDTYDVDNEKYIYLRDIGMNRLRSGKNENCIALSWNGFLSFCKSFQLLYKVLEEDDLRLAYISSVKPIEVSKVPFSFIGFRNTANTGWYIPPVVRGQHHRLSLNEFMRVLLHISVLAYNNMCDENRSAPSTLQKKNTVVNHKHKLLWLLKYMEQHYAEEKGDEERQSACLNLFAEVRKKIYRANLHESDVFAKLSDF